MSIRRDFPDLPPVWALGTAVLEWLGARFLPLGSFWSPPAALAGIVLVIGGVALAGWAALWFRRKRTPIEPGETPRQLIVEGPYRFNRNPIYSGMALVLFGIALWLGAFSSFLLAAIFPIVIHIRFVRREEAMLREAFGEEAERFFARTRRW
ncbi:isoprenylcysteine carboxylmethyltransferase family protein [Aurantimonas sp. VKM B-3413]|uniref:methyltransferase family protein n=1 Tax=Aurantimonas sp. VKM B-3413 TaxID=2779401 RepID=UPI001E5B6D08|nr:isoprenylcysteine carboxylmethyltransferase family protein [Aurantimonas sp. VKM B-3413]MCB8836542.1 isoprenylcysteine carboxylmethyltransferase family protein [Aurantimonas sp. VKM B-3413]